MQLVEFGARDGHLLARLFQSESVMRFTLEDRYSDRELRALHRRILKNNASRRKRNHSFKVMEGDDFVGFADIEMARTMPEGGIAEIGYLIVPERWNRGYGTKIVGALIDICFNQLLLHKVVATCNVANEASWKIMERVGMKREGTFKAHRYKNGSYADEYQYGLLKGEQE